MTNRNISGLLVAVLAAVALASCSGQSPVAPNTRAGAVGGPTAAAVAGSNPQAGVGIYTLQFFDDNAHQIIVSSLPAGHELVLWAQVKDSLGNLAQKGAVTFQVCKSRGTGFPFASSTECDAGSATWGHVSTMDVTAGTCGGVGHLESGNACIDFGAIQTPNSTVGFRYLFNGRGSSIANHSSPSLDVTWM